MRSLPKVELHLHLEGAAPPGFIRDLAARRRRDVAGTFAEDGSYRRDGFAGFLRIYETASAVIEGPEDYAHLLRVVLENCAENGAIHAELFVSPEFCGGHVSGGDLPAWRDHVAAWAETAAAMEKQGITSRGIVTAIRHLGDTRARRAAICAAETAGVAGAGWIAGFGLAGDETAGRPQDFAWAFDCAREAGLGLTCHAGEWRGPQSVRDALSLGVSRIGHGIRAIEDMALVRDLADRGVTLEVCPGGNIALGAWPDWRTHPIARLADAGCRVTVSTDDPTFFGTSLTQEYDRLADAFGWGEAEFGQMNRWALDAAFCDAATRERLAARLASG